MLHYFQTYYFVNVARDSCLLAGFPGVHYLDATKQPMQHRTARGGGYGGFPEHYTTVVVPAGGRASFGLSAADYDAERNRSCPTSRFIAVYPPDNTVRIIIPVRAPVCGDTVYISPVSRFKPGDARAG